MQELRQRVDRDLLAGGPWKKQRELFEEQLRGGASEIQGVQGHEPGERLTLHSVPRSPEPEFLAELRSAYTNWDDLDGGDRRRIRDALARDFGLVCAYCEQFCQPTQSRAQTGGEESPPPPDEESIDHLRPRSLFPNLWLDWPNLIYALLPLQPE